MITLFPSQGYFCATAIFSNPCIYVFWIVAAAKPCQYRGSAFQSAYTPQTRVWEKRKFITETHYCITVGNIAEDFYPEIAACEPQWEEWQELFHIDEAKADLFTCCKDKKDKRIEFLQSRPTLVLDTKHFDQRFLDRLLGSFDDLDEMTDGLLIHSENWQALNLLTEQ